LFFYTLLYLTILAIFYAFENETRFPDTLFAFLLAFLLVLPIWCMSWCYSRIRPQEFTDEEIEQIIEDRMPFDTKDDDWDEQYSSDEEHQPAKSALEFEADGDFAPPEIISGFGQENINNDDLQRIFTDIDEEVDYLEDNYMPEETNWDMKKQKNYKSKKLLGLIKEHENNTDESSLSSQEDRRGFEQEKLQSHWPMARDAQHLGFIPVNENEEYDVKLANEVRLQKDNETLYYDKTKMNNKNKDNNNNNKANVSSNLDEKNKNKKNTSVIKKSWFNIC